MGKQTPLSAMATHRDSHTISKVKNHHQQPKIRIIHIFAPEIIKTDVSNFRELVQRLTGKHAYDAGDDTQNQKQLNTNQKQMKKIPSPSSTLDPSKATPTKSRRKRGSSNFNDDDDDDEVEVRNACNNEEMVWKMKGEDNHHGGGFGIVETFFGEMEEFKYKIDDEEEQLDEFSSLLPMDATTHMHAFEAAQLA